VVVVEEEKLSIAAEAIKNNLLALQKQHRPNNQEPLKRHYIWSDRGMQYV
jgi:hypothetical protein